MIDGLLQKLCAETGLREALAYRIITSASARYKDFLIKKRDGSDREISQPSREVKLLQRAFVHLVLEKLPIHSAATAYVAGGSTLKNALPHAGHGPILKFDFKDFFPSIRSDDWVKFCLDNEIFSDKNDIQLSSSLLFRKGKGQRVARLTIGAPSSPMLSNVIMYQFDKLITESVSVENVIYTRYADDLTFSAPRTGFLVNVRDILSSAIKTIDYPKLRVNESKTNYVTTRYGRSVTGIILANDGTVGIGKEKRRILHSSVHRALNGKLDFNEMRRLAGMLAYVNSVEPRFIGVLARKYGLDIIQRIQKTVVIGPVKDVNT